MTDRPSVADDHGDAIRRLLYAYADAIDAGDFEAVGALFARGELAGSAGTTRMLRGQDAVSGHLRHRVILHDGSPRTCHLTLHVVVDVRNDRASARSRFAVLQHLDDRIELIAAGAYRDSFSWHHGAWWFDRREVIRTLSGDLSQHLRAEK